MKFLYLTKDIINKLTKELACRKKIIKILKTNYKPENKMEQKSINASLKRLNKPHILLASWSKKEREATVEVEKRI